MIKFRVLLPLCIITVLFIIGCTEELKTEYRLIYDPPNIKFCDDIPFSEPYTVASGFDKSACYISYGYSQKNAINCEVEEKQLCNIGVNIKNNNNTFCNTEMCSFGEGLFSSNVALCDSLNTSVQTKFCRLGFAIKNDQFELCDSLIYEQKLEDKLPSMPTYYGLRDSCYALIALQTDSPSLCRNLNATQMESCFLFLAYKTKKQEICEDTGENKKECLKKLLIEKAINLSDERICYTLDVDYDTTDCVIQIAKAKQNEHICENIPNYYGSEQEICYKEVAIAKNDVSLCEQTDGSISEECYHEILLHSEYPEEVCLSLNLTGFVKCYKQIDCNKSNNKTLCESVVEDAKNNPELCEYESSERNKQDCYGSYAIRSRKFEYCLLSVPVQCVVDFAVATNNISYCDTLDYDYLHSCYRTFNITIIAEHKIEKGISDIEECKPFMGTDRDVCYQKKARETKNVLFCNDSGVLKTVCYEEIATFKQDSTLCENAQDRDRCYFVLATDLKNIELCNKINSNEKKDFCYIEMATHYKNPDFCNLARFDNTYLCYVQLAKATGNKEYCNDVKPESRREHCYSSI